MGIMAEEISGQRCPQHPRTRGRLVIDYTPVRTTKSARCVASFNLIWRSVLARDSQYSRRSGMFADGTHGFDNIGVGEFVGGLLTGEEHDIVECEDTLEHALRVDHG